MAFAHDFDLFQNVHDVDQLSLFSQRNQLFIQEFPDLPPEN